MNPQEIDEKWGEILKAARKHPDMDKEIMFDDVGAIVTANRPMIESMVCDKTSKSHRLMFYLAHLGFYHPKGRILKVGIGNKMPMGIGGKHEKVKRKR